MKTKESQIDMLSPYAARDILHEYLVKNHIDYDLAADIVEELPYSTVEKLISKHGI